MTFDVEWTGVRLRPVEELVRRGFERSRVVMANEAHSGLQRCPRTRRVGKRLVTAAHEVGVRHMAMEAVFDRGLVEEANAGRALPPIEGGYLAQPEMRELVQLALDLGWTLLAYEADARGAPEEVAREGTMSNAFTNWREGQQARNLAELTQTDAPLLVWCGNGHHEKSPSGWWLPMGYQFLELTGIDPFCIDQILTVEWPSRRPSLEVTESLRRALEPFDGTAGVFRDEVAFLARRSMDAFILSTDNAML